MLNWRVFLSCFWLCDTGCPQQKLSGFTVDGTFAQYVVSYVHHVTPIPDELPSDAAASILCAVRRFVCYV